MTTVALRVHADALRAILRLPADMTITNAAAEAFATSDGGSDLMLVLTVDAGNRAPTGAVDMAPAYVRDSDQADPVRLREVCWTTADGQHIVQPIELDPANQPA